MSLRRFFDRLLSASRPSSNYRRTLLAGRRGPRFEPLEERRLLSVTPGTFESSGYANLQDVPDDKVGQWIADQIVARGSEGSSVNLDEEALAAIRAITRTGADEQPVVFATSESLDLIDVDEFQTDARFDDVTGSGYAVVVLDSGLDVDHSFFGPDSDSDGVADRLVCQYDFVDNDADVSTDSSAHGSNVTSIIASENGTYPGVAPTVDIIHLKIATLGDAEEALQWVVNNASTYNVAAVNMSFGDGGNYSTATTGILSDELAALVNMDIIVVSASGNSFCPSSAQGVAYPSADPNSLSVGAVYDGDIGAVTYPQYGGAAANETAPTIITPFSQRDDSLTTVMAPGAAITGAGLAGGTITYSGTSQAAPHVTGMAILAQELAVDTLGRRLSQEEFVEMLRDTGTTINDGDDENDNVTNTNLDFQFVNMFNLAEAIDDMVIDVDADSAGTNGADNGYADTFLVECSGDNVDIYVNSTLYKSVRADWVESITINGSSDNDTVTIEDLGSDFAGTVTANGGTGTDTAYLYDSVGNDTFAGGSTSSTLDLNTDEVIDYTVSGFDKVEGFAQNGGDDYVILGDDAATNDRTYLQWNSTLGCQDMGMDYGNNEVAEIVAHSFETGDVNFGVGGTDTNIAELYDSTGNDTFTATATLATMELGSGVDFNVSYFSTLYADFDRGGTDYIDLAGSAGVDALQIHDDGLDLSWLNDTIALQISALNASDTVYAHNDSDDDDSETFDGTPLFTYDDHWVC